ncbi:hypothetical protein CO172_01110 [Candidatus Uhrbacteria bacterium CG_4_9_14_3_um_filter_36_7]|uniref:Methicillin resistance protein n=1 Tax=Candidatus Uhrbacteria bacterium CG_4_9_14_3_um_filter_36_7 TaxID=1975033 RepID=A0A2M7XI11_9BACT|nr:MAG: hypothetical protein CO172_01110 [Candidatus Uhrbacteria bacterium CG_4_9_14_3_um_filter_36_7]
MYIQEIQELETWENFVKTHGPRSGSFLHAWDWGQFQISVGKQVKRLGFYQNDELIGIIQVIKFLLPFKQYYFFCPRGPIFSSELLENKELFKNVMQQIQEKLGGLFFRFECTQTNLIEAKHKHIHKTLDIHPHTTLLLNLHNQEEFIRSQMHPKTRYNISLARRRGVTVKFQVVRFEEAWPLFEQTAKRDNFRLHESMYYKKMLTQLDGGDKNGPCVFLAVSIYEDKIVATNIMVDYHGVRTYLHGASSYSNRSLMAPYLLHFELIKDGKEKGMHSYDWWGIAPLESGSDHPWAGITRFKKGFGGEIVSYPGTYDFVFDEKMYYLYNLLRKLRRNF